MDPATDLIEHFKLDVVLFPDHTRHTFYHSDGSQNRRKVKVVKRWVRQHELGEGGGGTVWLEKDSEGDERAVKQISKGLCLRNRIDYRKEIAAMAKLTKHPELFVKLHGWFDDDTKVFLAMEYFKHGDLQNFMVSPLPERDVGIITWQLLEGLNVMHKHGFTHRDLKPQNIFVVAEFPTWWVKLGDFGIAKRIMNDQTALRTEVGTRDYQAPEVLGITDSEEELLYTSAVDLWALGCVMYKLLTLEKPFPKPSSLRSYCYSMKEFPVEPLYAKDVSENAVEFIRQLMRANPSERLDAETALKSDWRGLQDSFSGSERDSIAEEKDAAKIPVHEGSTTHEIEQDSTALKHLHRAGYLLDVKTTSDDLSTNLDAKTALHWAAKSGRLRALKYLLERGVNPSAIDNGEHSQERAALHYAAIGGYSKEVDIMIERGADVQALDAEWRSPLHHPATGGFRTISEALLKAGASVDLRTLSMETPLHCAAVRSHLDVFKLLLVLGAPTPPAYHHPPFPSPGPPILPTSPIIIPIEPPREHRSRRQEPRPPRQTPPPRQRPPPQEQEIERELQRRIRQPPVVHQSSNEKDLYSLSTASRLHQQRTRSLSPRSRYEEEKRAIKEMERQQHADRRADLLAENFEGRTPLDELRGILTQWS